MHTREVEEEAEVVWQSEWERKRGSRNRVFYSAAKPLREKVGALWHQRLRFFSPFSYRQSTLRLPNHWQADTLNNQLVKGVEHLATEEPDTAFPSTGGGAQNRAKRRGNVGTFLRGRPETQLQMKDGCVNEGHNNIICWYYVNFVFTVRYTATKYLFSLF